MISWREFLGYEFEKRGKDVWFTLGDEHINHMLIAMLIKEDANFLGDFIGRGIRRIEKFSFGRQFDLFVRVGPSLVLVEIKTWSKFTDNQKPPRVFDRMDELGADRIVYVVLWKKTLIQAQQNWPRHERIRFVDLPTLITALEATMPNSAMLEIALDYTAALKRCASAFDERD